MSVYSGRQGKSAARKHKQTKRDEAEARNLLYRKRKAFAELRELDDQLLSKDDA